MPLRSGGTIAGGMRGSSDKAPTNVGIGRRKVCYFY